MGFQELQHTADCAIRVWARDLESLFTEAAKGFYAAEGIRYGSGRAARHRLDLRGDDEDSLLVAFLTELIYYREQQNLGFEGFRLQVRDGRLRGFGVGRPIQSITRPIKAATYHQLHIRKTPQRYEVDIVFDV